MRGLSPTFRSPDSRPATSPRRCLGQTQFFKQIRGELAAANEDEIERFQRCQKSRTSRGRERAEYYNYGNLKWRECTSNQSLSLEWMTQSQDSVNIVSGIRANQNVRNRKDNNHSQCEAHTSNHGTPFIYSVFVPVKEHDWSRLRA